MLKKILLTSAALFAFLLPVAAMAGPLDAANNKLNGALAGTGLESHVETSIGNVVRAILSLVGTIFLVLTIYAGILWMTAQGGAEQIEKAQSIISAAIIGLFITMAAYAITTFVTGRLGQVNSGATTTTPAAGSCTQNSDCTGGKTCQNGLCKASATGGSCSVDTDCVTGESCNHNNGTCYIP